jgi:uncharacterized membrane protein
MTQVIRCVEGDDVARFMLQNAVDKEQDPQGKQNLTADLALLNTLIARYARTEGSQPAPVVPPQPEEKPAAEPAEEATPPARTVSTPAPPTGFPWYASGIIGLVVGIAATFALTRKK